MRQASAIQRKAAWIGIGQNWHASLALAALAAVAALVAGSAAARQSAQSASSSAAISSAQNQNDQAQSTDAGSTAAASTAAQQDPLAAAARKVKAEHSHTAKAKVFTNDNLPTQGVVSTVGVVPAAANPTAAKGAAAAASSAQGETYWRDKFAALNKKLSQDQAELDVMERELGQLNVQNYSDPNKAMQQGYSRSDIDEKTATIAAKQKDVAADQQAISDAEMDLRKSGGDAGWSR